MTGAALVQSYLLLLMTPSELSQRALRKLGVHSAQDKAAVEQEAISCQLDFVTPAFVAYPKVLGKAARTVSIYTPDGRQETWHFYRLDTWPDFYLALVDPVVHRAYGPEFVRTTEPITALTGYGGHQYPEPRPTKSVDELRAKLVPWGANERDVVGQPQVRFDESWFPSAWYLWEPNDGGGQTECVSLCFQFGLLQEIREF